jgi:hypothetical protein
MLLLTALLMAATEPVLPDWMAGCWEQRSGDRWSEECWTIPRAGMMMGSGRSGVGDRLSDWETMQILLDYDLGGQSIVRMVFIGAPKGKNGTVFAWSPSKDPGLTFGNQAHDYPQRIRYWREGEELVAEIALADGTRPVRWRYRRMGN